MGKLNVNSGEVLRVVLEGLESLGVTALRFDLGSDRGGLHVFSEDGDLAWYETTLGMLDAYEKEVLTVSQTPGCEHMWWVRWTTPWNPASSGSWLGPYPTEDEALKAARGEYSA